MPTLQYLVDELKKLVRDDPNPTPMVMAKRAVKTQVIVDYPLDSADLTAAQKKFCDIQKKHKRMDKNFEPRLKGQNEEMLRRKAYSERCRNVLMEYAQRQVEQFQQWDAAVNRLNLGKNKEVDPLRWMSRLIKTDGSAASAAFNDKVVAMAALGQGVITMDEFRKCRKEAYERDNNVPKNEIDKLVDADCKKGVEGLLDILDEKIAEGRSKAPEIKAAAKRVLSGNLNDQQLKAAFDVIESDASYLMYNALNTMNDLGQNFRVKIPEEKLANRSKQWEGDSTVPLAYQAMAEQVANPYYAILDPQELYENQIYSFVNPNGQNTRDDLATLFSQGVANGALTVVEYEVDQQLGKYGISHNDVNVMLAGQDYSVYQKDGRTMVIAAVPPCQENNFEATILENVPGRIMKNLPADIEAKCQKCENVNTGRSSDEFDKMKDKLEALRGKQLPESPNLEQVGELMEQLAALEKATQGYLDRKMRQRKNGKGKNPYEQARMDFAAELKKFTEEQLTHLGYVQSHLSLQQLVLENGDGVRTAEAVEPKGNLEPQEDKLYGRPNVNEKAPDPKQKKLPEKFVFEGEFMLTVDAYTDQYKSLYEGVEKQVADKNKEIKNDKKVVWDKNKAAAEKVKGDLEMQLDPLGKKYMAGAVVKELLAMEKKLSGKNGPMQQLAADKKTGELVAMVWNSESFIDKVRALDFSVPGEMDKQVAANTPKLVAKEIMQNYLSHQRNAQQRNNQQIAPDNNEINVINVNNGGKNKNPLGF